MLEFNFGFLNNHTELYKKFVPEHLLHKMMQNTVYKSPVLMKKIPEWFLFYTISVVNMKPKVKLGYLIKNIFLLFVVVTPKCTSTSFSTQITFHSTSTVQQTLK